MENRDISQYIGFIKRWKTLWDTRLESAEEVAAVILDVATELHLFFDAILAVADSQVFTPESHKAFTAVFRPSKGAAKQSQLIRDLIRIIKANPTWKMLEDDALASASSELHGSSSTMQAVKTKTEDFEQEQFQESVLANFTTWRSSMRGSVWRPFETRLLEWLTKKTSDAEADTALAAEEWQPTWVMIIGCLADGSQTEAVAASLDLAEKCNVIASNARARAGIANVKGWAHMFAHEATWDDVFAHAKLGSTVASLVGHEDLAEKEGVVEPMVVLGARTLDAFKMHLAVVAGQAEWQGVIQCSKNLIQISDVVDNVVPEGCFADFINKCNAVVSESGNVPDGGGKPKKQALEKFKRTLDTFNSTMPEAVAEYVTLFTSSPIYKTLAEKFVAATDGAKIALTTALTTAVQEAKLIAAGGDAGSESSWKSEAFDSLKDLVKKGSDNTSSFVKKGEERSKLYEKLDKAKR